MKKQEQKKIEDKFVIAQHLSFALDHLKKALQESDMTSKDYDELKQATGRVLLVWFLYRNK